LNPRVGQPQPNLGKAIRDLRQAQGATLKEVAPKAGITLGTLALIERGETNPTWGTVSAIAAALETPLNELGAMVDRLDGTAISKAHPDARRRGIGFKIGNAFPADSTVARWVTALAMGANYSVYLNVRLVEGDLPPEANLYYFRLIAGHFLEAAKWLRATRKRLSEVDEFIAGLTAEDQERYENIAAFASQKHPLHKRLKESRSTHFHFPEINVNKEAAGLEELANAMREAASLEGWIEDGKDYASFRAAFADEVAVQFLATNDKETAEILSALHGPVFELVEFTTAVLLAYLKTLPKKATIIWEEGKVRPRVPGADPVDKLFRKIVV
jgi:transcriptional regulator with XRE-family HTH domain